jgi:kumamolisin
MVLGGTTVATALWAGLIALLNQGLGRNIGNINPVLYREIGPAGVLHSITEGNNNVGGVRGYTAAPGWNACAGWGSPDGTKLLEALRSSFGTPVQ